MNAKLLVVGAGGLGCPVLMYSASSGIGTIGVIDHDEVGVTNLQRQVIYENNDIRRPKVECVKDKILDLNPEIKINCYHTRLNDHNVESIFSEYDIIADCTDNFRSRFLISNYCHRMKKPLIFGAAEQFSGHISTFKSFLGPPHPCYHCFNPNIQLRSQANECSRYGILGSIVGTIGTWQATEIIKEILNIGESLSGFVLIFNGLKNTLRKIRIKRNHNCICCSHSDI